MAGTYTPMATYMTTYRSNDKCQSGNFTGLVLLKSKLLRQTDHAFKRRCVIVLCAALDMAVLNVMRSVFQVRIVTEALSYSASPPPSHRVVEDTVPSTSYHTSPHFSSRATQRPGVKRRPVDM